jgi:hypothetical protein
MKATADNFTGAMRAEKWADAAAAAKQASDACAKDPLVRQMLETFRASAVYRGGDPKAALEIVDAAQMQHESAFWLESRLIAAAASRKLGDRARYLALRDEMIAAETQLLTGGPKPYMEKVERFETPYAVVDAFQELPRGRGLREVFFLAAPKNGDMPLSVSISFKMSDKGVQETTLGHADETWCDGNALMATSASSRTYAEVKAEMAKLLAAAPGAVRQAEIAGMRNGAADSDLCPQASFIFRGLTPG